MPLSSPYSRPSKLLLNRIEFEPRMTAKPRHSSLSNFIAAAFRSYTCDLWLSRTTSSTCGMFKYSSAIQVLLLLVLQLVLLLQTSKCSVDQCIESPSSCGPIGRITYPFRVKTDPADCGNKLFEISCESNVPVIYFGSGKYYVRSINYNNYTIRLSDASLVPLLSNSFVCNQSAAALSDLWDSGSGYSNTFELPQTGRDWNYDMFQTLAFISCPSPIANPKSYNYIVYEDGSVCVNDASDQYWYAIVAGKFEPVTAGDVADSCRLELVLATSTPLPVRSSNLVSYKDVYDCLDYGFELSWFSGGCLYYVPESNGIPCYYLTNMTIEEYDAQTNAAPSTFLRSLLTKLVSSALGQLLVQINWDPPLYYSLTTFGYILALLRYALLLCVLHHGTFFCLGAPLLIFLLVYKWRRRHMSFYENIEEFLESYDQLMPVRYSYRDIKKITEGFADKLGEGGYGTVYKGKLRSGHFAAVKVLGKAKADGKEFMNEVATIGRVHHVNVVRLIGFCAEGSKRALVYDFMPNGSLEKYILSGNRNNPGSSNMPIISNEKMYDIALGVARGIEYLHEGCEMQILHFDIKPHNILLDENFVPKVADFGLAKLYPTDQSIVSLTAVRGTIGYMAPEFFYKSVGGVSYKADVYSFGRMLMEMAAKKRDSNLTAEHSSQIFLPSWVHDQFSQGNHIDLGESNEKDKEITKKMMMVGLWCVQLRPSDRPSMHKVIEMLQSGINRLHLPPKPSFAPQEVPMTRGDSTTGMTGSSWASSSVSYVQDEDDALTLVADIDHYSPV